MIIDADDTSGMWNDNYYYDFLIDNRDDFLDPIDLVIDMRKVIANRPVTSTTVNLKKFLEEEQLHYLRNHYELVYFVGAWHNPYPATAPYRIVNPKSCHVSKYSDSLTWCDSCENAFVQTTNGQKEGMSINEHLGCPMYHKQHTNAEINRKRASILRTVLRLNYNATDVTERFGIKSDTIKPKLAARLGVDMKAEREAGQRLSDNTMAHLVFKHSTTKIAEAFDMTRYNVTNRVKNNTGVSPQKAYEQRRWG